jgi:hypothetical protein
MLGVTITSTIEPSSYSGKISENSHTPSIGVSPSSATALTVNLYVFILLVIPKESNIRVF